MIDKEELLAHEYARKKLWCDTSVAVNGASNSTNSDTGIKWANKTLDAFDKRFPAPSVTKDDTRE